MEIIEQIMFIAQAWTQVYIYFMRGTTATILILAFASLTYGQITNENEINKLRIAQALEQAGEFDKAVDFYKQLYQLSPRNVVYFDGLRRSFMELKQYDGAKELLTDRLKTDPSNVVMMCQLGDIYFKCNKKDSAMTIWGNAMKVDPKNPNTYRTVASTMAEDRLFDDAIDVYRKGEAAVDSTTIFTNEIARVYFLHAEYGKSLGELLNQLQGKETPYALSSIESQLSMYASSKDAVDQFTSEMEKEVSANPDDSDYRELLGFLCMQKKNYGEAYTTYKWLDYHSGKPGSELIQFAASAYNDEAYNIAASAYKEVAGVSKDNLLVAEAIYGSGNSLAKIGEANLGEEDLPCSTTDSLSEFSQALAAYGRIIEQYQGTQFLAPSVLNSVEIRMKYFHDFSGSERLLSDYGDLIPPSTDDWTILRIRLFMMEGKFHDAFSTSLGVMGSSANRSQNLLDKIQFQAALALYYMGLYDSSTFYLKKITSNPSSDAANDAIQLLNTISNNRANPPALRAFASASALEESGSVSQAAAVLEKLLNDYPNVPLDDNARFNLAADRCKLGDVAASLKYYSFLVEDSTGVFADRAAFRICRIYQGALHQNQKAIDEYEKFLVRFPDSIYQDRVREILRGLLGENS